MSESIENIGITKGQPLDVVILAAKKTTTRCRILTTGQTITLRGATDGVEGEILTVKPSRVRRQSGGYFHVTGVTESRRIEVSALHLQPLAIGDMWPWDPKDEYWGDSDDPLNKYFTPIIDFGVRNSFEMEQVLPFQDPRNLESDPILDASELHNMGDFNRACRIMERLLTTDLRCLDAHAHLGNWAFNGTDERCDHVIDKARRHYEVGVEIGKLSFDDEFNGVLPWSRINNRPFLRCLHGYGLSLWRLGRSEEARKILERTLWLNPLDDQGIRFLLADIDAGKTWYDSIE